MKDIFCRIIDDEIPAKVIYDDNIVKVIMDVNPRSNGHLLIIPKTHYQDLYDISDDVVAHIMKIARNMCNKLSEKLGCSGITLEQNNGSCQEVKHFHLHLIPIYENENLINDIDIIFSKIMK